MSDDLTQAEQWALKWLQSTGLPSGAYKSFAYYFQQLIDAGWSEDKAMSLDNRTFDLWLLYEQTHPIATFLEFATAYCTFSDGIEQEDQEFDEETELESDRQ